MKDCFSFLCFLCMVGACFAFAPRKQAIRHDASTSTSLNAKTAVIAGATGYIGKSTVRESIRQGYQTFALVRNKAKVLNDPKSMKDFYNGAEIIECDVTNDEELVAVFKDIKKVSEEGNIDAVVSCLASRSGVKKDAYLIDYQATLNCLNAGIANDAKHFVLLSAFCVKNPWLQFQQAKLKFEAALQEQNKMTYTVVRPTAFFKSVSGQLEVVQNGAPYVMFGDGEVTRCNPIAESELAQYLLDSVTDVSRRNKIINLGGPDEPLTMRKQGAMMFKATGMEPKYYYAPLWIFDTIINGLQFLADITKLEALEDAAETGRIGKYYAVEDMLTTSPDEKFGKISLQDHYNRIAVEGQEYDPYTSMFARARVGKFGNPNDEKTSQGEMNNGKIVMNDKSTFFFMSEDSQEMQENNSLLKEKLAETSVSK